LKVAVDLLGERQGDAVHVAIVLGQLAFAQMQEHRSRRCNDRADQNDPADNDDPHRAGAP